MDYWVTELSSNQSALWTNHLEWFCELNNLINWKDTSSKYDLFTNGQLLWYFNVAFLLLFIIICYYSCTIWGKTLIAIFLIKKCDCIFWLKSFSLLIVLNKNVNRIRNVAIVVIQCKIKKNVFKKNNVIMVILFYTTAVKLHF